jgi:hypothetical protein
VSVDRRYGDIEIAIEEFGGREGINPYILELFEELEAYRDAMTLDEAQQFAGTEDQA